MPDSNEFFQSLNADEAGYQKLADWLKLKAGIHLPASAKNRTLMASRMSRLLNQRQLRSYGELYRRLQAGDRELQKAFIEGMTTNMTEFFREAHHFEVLPDALQEIVARKGGRTAATEVRIWCAAASRGHEVYSILFTILEAGLNPAVQRLKFLASDIDQTVLAAASKGVYRAEELSSVAPHLLDKYMVRLRDSKQGGRWKVRDELRDLITFAPFNLIEFPYAFQHRFDIIFCRNVLIYFDRETMQKVKDQLAKVLAPDGYLFIGHSETGAQRIDGLQSIDTAIFRKQDIAS